MYVASRGHLKRKVPTVVVPKVVKATVEKLFEIQRELDDSPLPVNLIGMDVSAFPHQFRSRVKKLSSFLDAPHLQTLAFSSVVGLILTYCSRSRAS